MATLKLNIRKKVTIENPNSTFLYRSEWRTVGKLAWNECHRFFKMLNGYEGIESDAQFASFLKATWGNGIYYVQGWSKGREGFFNFMKLECKDTTFKRLPKRLTIEQIENQQLKSEKLRLLGQAKTTHDPDQKELIQDRLNEINDEVSLNNEIKNFDKKKECSAFLKSILPIYKEHRYDAQLVERKRYIRVKEAPKPVVEEDHLKPW